MSDATTVYAKFSAGSKCPPLGTYNPDCAVLMEQVPPQGNDGKAQATDFAELHIARS